MEIEKYLNDSNFSDESESSTNQDSDTQEVSNQGESKELSLEDQLNGFESKEDNSNEEKPEFSLIDELNSLGVIRQGLPVEFDNIDRVKEYLSKGFDYTVKTQELSDQRKEFETQMKAQQDEIQKLRQETESFREENYNKIIENEAMAQVLQELRTNDPDAFSIIANSYQRIMGAYQASQNNPMFQGFNKKISELEQKLNSQNVHKTQEENQNIVKEWESGLQEVQSSFGAKLKKLGIKPNWAKVQTQWQADTTNSTSVKDAFFAIHGDQITKALEAQSKLNATKAKSNLRSGPQNNNANNSDQAKSQHGSGTYLKDLEMIAQRYS